MKNKGSKVGDILLQLGISKKLNGNFYVLLNKKKKNWIV